MSLEIFIDEIPKERNLIHDVRGAFSQVILEPSSTVKVLLKEIEIAEYLDGNSFIDRFGFKLPLSELSESCKAALCTECFPNYVIDTVECGWNAINTIICNVTSGAILIHSPFILGTSYHTVDVICNGYKFTDGTELWHYLDDDYPMPLGFLHGGER